MKHLAILFFFLFFSFSVFGQSEARTVESFGAQEKIGNFMNRWYYRLRNWPVIMSSETLQLKDDSTYFLNSSGGCFRSKTSGTWTKDHNELILRERQSNPSEYVEYRYEIIKNKLIPKPGKDILIGMTLKRKK